MRAKKQKQLDAFIREMLRQTTIEKAAEAAGISISTAWRLRQTQEFRDGFKRAREEAYGRACARAQAGTNNAVTVLMNTMAKARSEHARVRAATELMKYAKEAGQWLASAQEPELGAVETDFDVFDMSMEELAVLEKIATR